VEIYNSFIYLFIVDLFNVVFNRLVKKCTNSKRQVSMVTKLFTVAPNFLVLSMEFASCHTSGNWNYEVAPIVLENS
jgi:multidrug transporter EmrE-like cation transporter